MIISETVDCLDMEVRDGEDLHVKIGHTKNAVVSKAHFP